MARSASMLPAALGAVAERVSDAALLSGSANALEALRRADAAGAPRVVPFGPRIRIGKALQSHVELPPFMVKAR
jgi:hypothetical protein